MAKIMTDLALKLTVKGGIDVREAFIDATFAAAKKGGAQGRKDETRQGNKDHGDCGP
jgi:hypothetical protein